MIDFIEDTEEAEIPELTQRHKKAFGIEPVVIGMYWSDREALDALIEKAIIDGKPYDEYEELTDEVKKAYDAGELVF